MTFTVRDVLKAMVAIAMVLGILAWQPWLSSEDREWNRRAWEYETANIEAEVERAIQAGDFRFMAVMGIGLLVPGVPPAEWADGNVQVIRGTSDAMESSSHRRFVVAAEDYAERYNALMLQHRVSPARATR